MPSNEWVHSVYAGFFVRLAAYLCDLLIFGALTLAVRIPVWLYIAFSGESALTRPLLFRFSLWDILLYLAAAVYFILMTYYSGATLGKKLFNLRVVTARGERPALFSIIYRETVGRYLSSLAFIGYVMVGVTTEKKGLHDILADTRVVYTCRMAKDYHLPAASYGRPDAAGGGRASRSPYAPPPPAYVPPERPEAAGNAAVPEGQPEAAAGPAPLQRAGEAPGETLSAPLFAPEAEAAANNAPLPDEDGRKGEAEEKKPPEPPPQQEEEASGEK